MESAQSNKDVPDTENVDKVLNTVTQSLSVFDFPTRPPPGTGPSFYNWREVYPELGIFLESTNFADVVAEAKSVPKWTPWPGVCDDYCSNAALAFDLHSLSSMQYTLPITSLTIALTTQIL